MYSHLGTCFYRREPIKVPPRRIDACGSPTTGWEPTRRNGGMRAWFLCRVLFSFSMKDLGSEFRYIHECYFQRCLVGQRSSPSRIRADSKSGSQKNEHRCQITWNIQNLWIPPFRGRPFYLQSFPRDPARLDRELSLYLSCSHYGSRKATHPLSLYCPPGRGQPWTY